MLAYWFGRGLIGLLHRFEPMVIIGIGLAVAIFLLVIWILRRGGGARSR
jgi:hypothetical protein